MAAGSEIGSKGYALITGASSGLGKTIASQLAARGYNLILAALPDELLESAGTELQQVYGVNVQTVGVDLSTQGAAAQISEFVESRDLPISILVNNVGMGYVAYFEKMPLEFYEKVNNLNSMTMARLTYFMVPRLLQSNDAHVLSIGSIASLFPAPYKAMYSATKHFVRSLSLSLREEYRGRINFTVSYPPGIITNDDIRKRTESFGWWAKMGIMEAEDVARVSLKAMFRKKRYVNPGTAVLYQIVRYIIGYGLAMKILVHNFRKGLEENKGKGM